MNEQEVREHITNIFVFEYLPKMKKEIERFTEDSYNQQKLADVVSGIVGKPISVYLGELKIADPTNEIIDNLVKIYVKLDKEKERNLST